ncbi:MAG TPA: response regulator [Candidatus Udaeobacter sp.]|nr:response regulator [Candidatus Udaeobacter sp.]
MVKNKILIVEDELDLLGVLAQKFDMEKFEVFKAANGQLGLEEALKSHPDLILLDIIMPVMDGVTMLKMLREDSWGKDVPVILLTNLSDESKIAEAMQHGVYDYLVKADWNINDVVAKVKSRLK